MIAGYLVALEDELSEARKRKDRSAAAEVQGEITSRLDALVDDRRANVRTLMEVERELRAQAPTFAGKVMPYKADGMSGPQPNTETRRYIDGRVTVLDSVTGEVISDGRPPESPYTPTILLRRRAEDMKRFKPVPTSTATKGRTLPNTS
jgi:hypothetical protein